MICHWHEHEDRMTRIFTSAFVYGKSRCTHLFYFGGVVSFDSDEELYRMRQGVFDAHLTCFKLFTFQRAHQCSIYNHFEIHHYIYIFRTKSIRPYG